MIEQKRPKEKTAEKKPTPTAQLAPDSTGATPETLSQANQTPDAQNTMLRRMPTAQQHHLMRQMGQLQGNQYTQQIAAQLRPSPAKGAIAQRQTPDVQTAPAAKPAIIGTATVISATLNVRSSPQVAGETNLVGKLQQGAKVDVVEKGEWLKISYNGGVAYISGGAKYVTFAEKSAAELKAEGNKDKAEKNPNIFQRLFNWVGAGIKKLVDLFTMNGKGVPGLEKMLQTLETIQAEDRQVVGERSTAAWGKAKVEGKAEREDKSIVADSKFNKEIAPDQAYKAVELIKKAREIVGTLTTKDVKGDEKALEQLKADYYSRLAKLSPYYTQIANKAILSNVDGVYQGAWWRTCNATSLSMALNGLGISPSDFKGDKELLKKIAGKLGVPQAQLDSLASLRMPDFIQLVAVYHIYVAQNGAQFDETKVEAARASATGKVLEMNTLGAIGELFGASFKNDWVLQTYGAQKNALQPTINQYKKHVEKLGAETTAVQGEITQLAQQGPAALVLLDGKSDYQIWKNPAKQSADQAEYEKQRAERTKQVTSHKTLEKQYNEGKEGEKPALAAIKTVDDQVVAANGVMVSKLQTEINALTGKMESYKDNADRLKAYKETIMKEVGGKMNAGSQIFVSVPGHYVRLEEVSEQGIVIDDPAWGKNTPLTWKQSYDAGYFQAYQTLSK